MAYSRDNAIASSASGHVTLPAYCMLALSLIGIAVALYVAHGKYTGQTLW